MNSILTTRGLSFELPNGRELFHHLNFSLEAGLTALVGPNGVGKTCLAKLLAGELEPRDGSVQRKGQVTFFPQRLEALAISVNEFLVLHYSWSHLGEKLLEGIDREAL